MKTLLSTSIQQSSLDQVIQKILSTGRITMADQQWLLQANTSSNPLNAQEIQLIQKVCDRLQMGLVKVID